jgi:hypothetical protein
LERAQRGGCDVSAVTEFDYEGSEMKSGGVPRPIT